MKVCFKGHVSGLFKEMPEGGGELQIELLSKALALSGHEVVVIDEECNEDLVSPEGIKVCAIPHWKEGLPIIRYMFLLLPRYYRLLVQQKADVYYCRMRDFQHIIMYLASRKVKGKFVMAMAADIDATGFKERYTYFYRKTKLTLWRFVSGVLVEIVQPYLLRRADIVLAQHEGQKKILADRNIPSYVFRNIFDFSRVSEIINPSFTDFIFVSARLDKRKGFVEMYQLILASPEQSFAIIGEPTDKISKKLFNELKTFTNVKLFGKLDHNTSIRHIANSKALLVTSSMEGFPNIFLEAWANGVPIISYVVDPGEFIEKNQLGLVCKGDFDLLCSNIHNFDTYTFDREHLKNYVRVNYSLEFANARFLDILKN